MSIINSSKQKPEKKLAYLIPALCVSKASHKNDLSLAFSLLESTDSLQPTTYNLRPSTYCNISSTCSLMKLINAPLPPLSPDFLPSPQVMAGEIDFIKPALDGLSPAQKQSLIKKYGDSPISDPMAQ